MVTLLQKSDLKYKSLEQNATTTAKGSSYLYSWILACVLIIIGLSFWLIAFSLENLYSLNNDFETLDPTILMSSGINKSETPLYAKRAIAYLQATHKYRKNSYKAVDFHTLPNTSSLVVVENFQLFCYYSLPHNDSSDLSPSHLNPHLCTHILLAFAQVSNNLTLVHLNTNHPQIFKEVVALKKINPKLKVLISVIDGGTGNFAKAISTRNNRLVFSANILEFLIEHKLDGVDLDWEFPGWPGPFKTDEKRLFRKLMQQIKYTLSGHFLLTVAVAAPGPIIDKAYDVPFMAKLVDYISIMGYDYHSYIWYLPVLGPNAPLYPSNIDSGYFQSLNSNWSVNYYLHLGMPANKILLGMPTYGHSFTLVNPDSTDYGSPASDIGHIGEEGFVPYSDIMAFLRDEDTIQIFDRDTRVPYAYRGNQWISFDNEQSLAYKTEYLMTKGLAGAMIWSLNNDDYNGRYHKTPFPLIRRIKKVLNDDDL
ncbi:hypothetical protein WDU94_004582 [Cyamophila willieti]